MKKLLALVMALVMALSCTAAFAESTAAGGTQTMLAFELNSDAVQAYVAAMDPDGSQGLAQTIGAAVDLIENLLVYIVSEGDVANVSLLLGENEVSIASATIFADENGLNVVSDLYPNCVVRVDGATMDDLLSMSFNGQTLTEEDLAALEAMVQQVVTALIPYGQDISTVIGQLEPVATEDGGQMITITSHHVAQELNAWCTRLSTDTVMQGYLQLLVDMVNGESGQQFTIADVLSELSAAAEQLLAAEPEDLGDVTLYQDADTGVTEIVITLMDSLYLSLSEYTTTEGGNGVGILMMTDSTDADGWDSVYTALSSGENTDDLLFDITIEIPVVNSCYILLHGIVDGVDYNLDMAVENQNGYFDTYFYAALNPGLGYTDGVVSLQLGMEKVESTGLTAPSTEGLNVIKITNDEQMVSEEDQQLLLNDLQNTGLTTLLTNALTAMPEQVTTLLTLLSAE